MLNVTCKSLLPGYCVVYLFLNKHNSSFEQQENTQTSKKELGQLGATRVEKNWFNFFSALVIKKYSNSLGNEALSL